MCNIQKPSFPAISPCRKKQTYAGGFTSHPYRILPPTPALQAVVYFAINP
jgi:hypothetical protein